MTKRICSTCVLALFVFQQVFSSPSYSSSRTEGKKILVVGSANADTFLQVKRLPNEGENLTLLPGCQPVVDVPGGKGCTQAVAAAKLLYHPHHGIEFAESADQQEHDKVFFVGQLGNDVAAQVLHTALQENGVDVSFVEHHPNLSSGRGYVFLTQGGQVSAVVSGGSNADGWLGWEEAWKRFSRKRHARIGSKLPLLDGKLERLLQGCKCIMLQREVPEYVNLLIASYAKQLNANIVVIQDVGGEDRIMDEAMLKSCDYLIPNETELRRLVESFGVAKDIMETLSTYDMAQVLQERGARNVLVTMGSRGSTLVTESGDVIHQPAFPVKTVVDETGAGDCYRAAFAVALIQQGKSPREAMEFASAAGACSVERNGAVPSTPSREEVEKRQRESRPLQEKGNVETLRGGSKHRSPRDGFPFLIGSRLNSMKDRPELWSESLNDPKDFVRRQSTVEGLTCVDFNYPQHFQSWTPVEAKAALDEAGLVAGAVCLRYPAKFSRGAMNHPDVALRREAIEITKQAAEAALQLGCSEVVVWSAFDGYDYPFQVDYDAKWEELVDAFRECCDSFPSIKFSIEYKPTDENTRFFTVPSTGAALLLVEEVDRTNFGLTLDVGHMLMTGENPGQSIAMVGRKGKLFGIQLNDGYTRLAAEDGLMFGSVHPTMALEICFQLHRTGFDGHLYFDTFPQRTDPVREAEYNIRRVKKFWNAAVSIDRAELERIMLNHDAVGALELVEKTMERYH